MLIFVSRNGLTFSQSNRKVLMLVEEPCYGLGRNNNSYQLHGTYYCLSLFQALCIYSALHTLARLILTTTLRETYSYYIQLKDEEMEAHSSSVVFLRSTVCCAGDQNTVREQGTTFWNTRKWKLETLFRDPVWVMKKVLIVVMLTQHCEGN